MVNQNILEMFDGKYATDFNETTLMGNNISGKILLNHGSFHGSLLITSINDEPVKQFVRGFPKIKYYDGDMPLNNLTEMDAYEKLDGTCIGFYQLLDNKGYCMEIVPKSRQKAVLDPHFMEMLRHCPTYLLYNRTWSPVNPDIIFCEMFGMMNEHTIKHEQTYIDLRLIGAARDDYMLTTGSLGFLSNILQIPMPRKVATMTACKRFTLNSYEVEGYNIQYENNPFDIEGGCHVNDGIEMVSVLKKELDNRNEIYKDYTGGNVYYEGVVIQNCYDGYNHYIKVKPDSFFEAEGRTKLGVPINEIRKEIVKIINENLTEYNETYNEKTTMQTINEMLMEDYSEDDVEHTKTQKVIRNELHKYIDSIQNKSINKIVDDLLDNNISNDTGELMRYFADKYPLLKHKSRDVYFVLDKRLKKKIRND